MSTNAQSGHGTIVSRENTPGSGTYTDIAELNDIALPGLSRNEFDATTQNEDIDSYVLGVLRRGSVTINVNFIPSEATHSEAATGLIGDIKSNVTRGYKFTVPNKGVPWIWLVSGQVQKVDINAPVDGKLAGAVALRLSGKFSINGVQFG
jgi:hypothetical protein